MSWAEHFCVFWDSCVGFMYLVTNGQVSRGFSKGVCFDNGVAVCSYDWDVDGTQNGGCFRPLVLP